MIISTNLNTIQTTLSNILMKTTLYTMSLSIKKSYKNKGKLNNNSKGMCSMHFAQDHARIELALSVLQRRTGAMLT